MSYANQREHALLDRQLIKGLLFSLAGSRVAGAPAGDSSSKHLENFMRQTGSAWRENGCSTWKTITTAFLPGPSLLWKSAKADRILFMTKNRR